MLDTGDIARLRAALEAAGFTYDDVAALLGEEAHAALGRNETTPAYRATADGSPLATLIRLFLLQRPVALAAAAAALPGLLAALTGAGFLRVSGEEVRAGLDIRPYAADDADWWVISDLTPGLDGGPATVTPDHVLGISPAATSLAQLTLRHRVGTAFDLGTGCGVQALHLAQHSDRVIASDVNERALALTRLTLALNGIANVEVRGGSLFEPLHNPATGSPVGPVDLIATNPPFVISPPDAERFTYRDSGLPGDSVVERIVREAPGHLNEGGWCQVLANWAITDVPWEERVGGWLDQTCDALVVQREVLDPAAYVELWLKDAGLHGAPGYRERYDAWLAWLAAEGITGVGFGWLNLRRREAGAAGAATHDLLDWPFTVEQPIAPAIAEWAEAVAPAADPADPFVDLLAARLARPADLIQESTGEPGAADPEVIVVRRQRGLRRARQVGTAEAALIGASDGELTVGQIIGALAHLTGSDPGELTGELLPVVRTLLREGFLHPVAVAATEPGAGQQHR